MKSPSATPAGAFDIVYDTVGGTALNASYNAVARFGYVVSGVGRRQE